MAEDNSSSTPLNGAFILEKDIFYTNYWYLIDLISTLRAFSERVSAIIERVDCLDLVDFS